MRKQHLPMYFVIASVVIGLAYFVSVFNDDIEKTTPKMKLSYFPTITELAQAVVSGLEVELRDENQFWIGIEPQKQAHINFAEELTLLLKSQNKIQHVYIDEQLGFKEKDFAIFTSVFPDVKIIPVRENWPQLAELYKKHEMNKTAVITAAIYSTSMLPENPIDKIKKDFPEFKPVTFSSGHFALNTEDEKNNIFPCFTEDKTGTNRWACALVNKARAQRRAIRTTTEGQQKKFLGMMDLTADKDYMILLNELKK